VRGGRTLPFSVTRGWNAPAGHYAEQWFLVDPGTKEVMYESQPRELLVWGLQSVTDTTDVITDPIPLTPGTYELVFALDGVKGGEVEIAATEVAEGVA
jgi:hypothetical protein